MSIEDKLKTMGLILQRMNVLYERMLGILARERSALISLDFETLMNEMREKDEIVSAIRGLDRDRLRIQDQFAVLMERDPETLTLREMCELLIEQGGSARDIGAYLMDLRATLNVTVSSLRERIDQNTVFIEKSVRNLQSVASEVSKAIGGRVAGQSPGKRKMSVYNGKAQYEQSPNPTGTIVEKRF